MQFIKIADSASYQQLQQSPASEEQHSDSVKRWTLIKESKGGRKAKFEFVRGIAVGSNGNIVVADKSRLGGRIHVLTGKCGYKFTLECPNANENFKRPVDVAVTLDNQLAVAGESPNVWLYKLCKENSGERKGNFTTVTENETPNTQDSINAVAVSRHNRILAHDCSKNKVTLHDIDGPRIRLIDLKYNSERGFLRVNQLGKVDANDHSSYLSVTRNNYILISDYLSRKMTAVKMSGDVIFQVNTWHVDGNAQSRPRGVTCDEDDNIYVAVHPGGFNSSHVHVYNISGEFRSCIATGLFCPFGMAWSNGSLYIANGNSVLIYEKPSIDKLIDNAYSRQ